MNTDDPLPTRASLLNRLKDAGDSASWDEFHWIYRGLLMGVARRSGLNDQEANEAVQDTLIAVARQVPEFRYTPGRDSFKGWLLQITRWKVADQFRQRKDSPGSWLLDDEREQTSVIPTEANIQALQDFEAIWNAEWERHLLDQALARVKRQVSPEHYAIYHLNVIEDRPASEVRQSLGVGMAAVYLAKHRVGAAVRKELRRLQEAAP